MKPRSLLVLFLIVAALGAFVWFFERDLPSTDERAELAKKVLPIEADAVTALSIERAGSDGSVVRLERRSGSAVVETAEAVDAASAVSGSDWRVVEPIDARADEDEIESVLDTLIGLTKERTLEDFAAEELGLTSPGLVVRLATAEREWVLEVGEEVPATSNVIAAVEGQNEAYVVSGGFRDDLRREPGDWRSRDVFPFDRGAVKRMVLSGGGEEVVLQRQGDDFRLQSPLADEADSDKVSDLLDALTGLEIDTFVDEPPALSALGLEPAVSTISLDLGAEQGFEIRLGGIDSEDEKLRYASAEGQVFEVDAESGAELLDLGSSPASEWRSRAWTTLDTYQIEKFRLREGESELDLERSEGDWLRAGDKIAYTTVSDVLYALDDVEALRIGGKPAGLGTPLLEIVLSSKDGDETLRLYSRTGDVYPGVREGREAVLELSRESVDELRAKIEAARDTEPLPAPSDEGDTVD